MTAQREYELIVRQQPGHARASGPAQTEDALRKPIDAPPVIQLLLRNPYARPNAELSKNPNYFMTAAIAAIDEEDELHWLQDGNTVSAMYLLQDVENGGVPAAFFVFPDLAVREEGRYRLRLSLYELVGAQVCHRKSVFSAPFDVHSADNFPGIAESTPLSCSLAEQGLKIRLRRDTRVRRRSAISHDS